MAPPSRELVDHLNALASDSRIAITETRDSLLVYQLNGREAVEVIALLEPDVWETFSVSDEGGELSPYAIPESGEGIRIAARRTPLPDGIEAVITDQAFERLLSRRPASSYVWVAGLEETVDTETVRYAPWGTSEEFYPKAEVLDPAKIVRFLRPAEVSRRHLGRYLMRDGNLVPQAAAMKVWKEHAFKNLLIALAQEVEPDGRLLLRGPPPVRFDLIIDTEVADGDFKAVQKATRWVYENDREAENRHALLGAEIARTARSGGNLGEMASGLELSLEGAKIAYSFGVSQQSKDTLKALVDLRKAVTDETSKLSETTRSLCTAVVGAVFGNIGLLLARTSLPSNNQFVGPAALLLGIVLALYVVAVICSGIQYISIQRQLRIQWRQKLYRFLSNAEYTEMVERPVKRAEKSFYVVSVIGLTMAALCVMAVHQIASL